MLVSAPIPPLNSHQQPHRTDESPKTAAKKTSSEESKSTPTAPSKSTEKEEKKASPFAHLIAKQTISSAAKVKPVLPKTDTKKQNAKEVIDRPITQEVKKRPMKEAISPFESKKGSITENERPITHEVKKRQTNSKQTKEVDRSFTQRDKKNPMLKEAVDRPVTPRAGNHSLKEIGKFQQKEGAESSAVEANGVNADRKKNNSQDIAANKEVSKGMAAAIQKDKKDKHPIDNEEHKKAPIPHSLPEKDKKNLNAQEIKKSTSPASTSAPEEKKVIIQEVNKKPSIPIPSKPQSIDNKKRLIPAKEVKKVTDTTERKPPIPHQKSKDKAGAIEKYSAELKEIIEGSILEKSSMVKWEDLVGLESLKKKMQECIVLPIRNPKLFTGLLTPSKGILLFGPPGNGKTMVAKAVASQCGKEVTFFNLSAGALTSRYFGDSEKLVRALFDVATERQPSVIFIDEIDSILGARSSGEHEVTRRLKTEFLVHFDGVGTKTEDRVLMIGATNRPYDLDDAVLRRFTARIFLPLPGLDARIQMINNQLKTVKNSLSEAEIASIGKQTEGYSFADLRALCQEAAMEPIRMLGFSILVKMEKEQAPEVAAAHFDSAIIKVPKSVSYKSIQEFEQWNKQNQK